MKKLVLLLMTLVSLSIAAVPAFADNMKIGVLNMQELLQKMPQMKQINDSMKKQFGDREAQIVSAQNDLKKAADDFRKNNAVMSDKDKQAVEQKLVKQEQDLQQMQAAFQKDYVATQNKQIASLLDQIKAVVKNVAAKDKYNLILINAGVAYADDNIDVTNEVLSQMPKS